MNKRAVSAIMIICLIPALAFGVTRKGAINYALKHSEFLKMAESSAKALEHEGKQASAISRPQVLICQVNIASRKLARNTPQTSSSSSTG